MNNHMTKKIKKRQQEEGETATLNAIHQCEVGRKNKWFMNLNHDVALPLLYMPYPCQLVIQEIPLGGRVGLYFP